MEEARMQQSRAGGGDAAAASSSGAATGSTTTTATAGSTSTTAPPTAAGGSGSGAEAPMNVDGTPNFDAMTEEEQLQWALRESAHISMRGCVCARMCVIVFCD